MSTYLELCRTVRELAGIPGTGPISVANQVGELKRLCGWVQQAWVEIQNQREDWEWMRKSFSFDTVVGQQEYEAGDDEDIDLTDFGWWRKDSFSLYLKSAGQGNETHLDHIDYNAFDGFYSFGTNATAQGRPTAIAITPSKKLALGFLPDDVYTVRGEYYKTPQILDEDADVPDMPARFHMLIVHRAMLKYGTFNAAIEVLQEHDALYRILLNKLEADQAPMVFLGGSMI